MNKGEIHIFQQWLSTFLMPGPFNTVPRVVVIPNLQINSGATSKL